MWRFIASWLGLNPYRPYASSIKNPVHGQEAKNSRSQKVIYDANQGNWVLPQNFSGKEEVTIK